ncbi:hypothetical protein GW17_00059006, partial [Ensete ventricosum]
SLKWMGLIVDRDHITLYCHLYAKRVIIRGCGNKMRWWEEVESRQGIWAHIATAVHGTHEGA